MRDVAREAEVSLKTVSRVVNGEGGVRPELTRRVEAAVVTLGYRPDDRARRLRSSATHTGTIGFVLIDVANPFFSSLLRGIEDVARTRDCLVISGSTDGLIDREEQLIDAFIQRRVDGLIVVPSAQTSEMLSREVERGTPLVLVDIELENGPPVDLVRSDHYGGARLATEHLIEHGHRSIAFMGDDQHIFSARERLRGFRDAMAAAELPVPEHHVSTGSHSTAEWRATGRELFSSDDPATAVFTAQNFITLGVVEALHDLGLHDRIAVIGFDDVDLAEVVEPAVTVVPQRPRELGRRAAELILARLDGLTADPVREIIPHRIIERGSGEIAPTRP